MSDETTVATALTVNDEIAALMGQQNLEDFKDHAKSSDFLPRFTLYISSSDAVKKDVIQNKHYGWTTGGSEQENVTDCGLEVRAWVLAYRLKALQLAPKAIAYYDVKAPEYQAIRSLALSNNRGNMCGPEFLLYLPEFKQFVTFYMASKTMRREAPLVEKFAPALANPEKGTPARDPRPCILKSRLIEDKENSWFGPTIVECLFPVDPPPQEQFLKELRKFMNPPAPKTVTVNAVDNAATNRAR